jgi:hypothetical protein
MDTNTVQIVQEFGNKLDGYITTLSSKLGVAADHFWPVFVKQQTIEGWMIVVGTVLVLIGAILFLLMAVKNTEKACSNDDGSWKAAATCGIGWAGGIVLATIFLCSAFGPNGFSSAVSKIANPEYSAVQALVRMVK